MFEFATIYALGGLVFLRAFLQGNTCFGVTPGPPEYSVFAAQATSTSSRTQKRSSSKDVRHANCPIKQSRE
jgi:hypothetical protein